MKSIIVTILLVISAIVMVLAVKAVKDNRAAWHNIHISDNDPVVAGYKASLSTQLVADSCIQSYYKSIK